LNDFNFLSVPPKVRPRIESDKAKFSIGLTN